MWGMADKSKYQPIPVEEVSPRIHYIQEWLDAAGLNPIDLARRCGVDKSSVSRWLHGAVPHAQQLRKVAAAFGQREVSMLFRPPGSEDLERAILDAAAVIRSQAHQAPQGSNGSGGENQQGPSDGAPGGKDPGGSRDASPRGNASQH